MVIFLELLLIVVLGYFTGILFGGESSIILGGIFWALIFILIQMHTKQK
ncbi:putative membrane protein [Brevibacillus laterosporus GI-9]|nr:putative membrane protein [Brevibacillus laterosporus GI-9]